MDYPRNNTGVKSYEVIKKSAPKKIGLKYKTKRVIRFGNVKVVS